MIQKKEREYILRCKKQFFNYNSPEKDSAFLSDYFEFTKNCIRRESIKEHSLMNPSKGDDVRWFLEKVNFLDRSIKNVIGGQGSLKLLDRKEFDYLFDKFHLYVGDELNYVLHNGIDYGDFLDQARENENESHVSLLERMISMVDKTTRCILTEIDRGSVIHFLPDLLYNLNISIKEHKSDLRKTFDGF